MIVVDVNVIAYLLIEGDKTALAQAAWEKDNDWLAPGLWRDEFSNILSTYMRNAGLSLVDAIATWRQAQAYVATAEPALDYEVVLATAIDGRISAYDAQYVSLAQAKGVPLISEDRQLQKSYPQMVISLASFCQD